jgi:phospholipid/cholesterol/gamma-HCH transport system substrate-binding protein
MNSIGPTVVKSVIAAIVMALCTAATAIMVSNAQFRPTTSYEAVLADSSGLRSGEEVRIAGVQVGRVEKVDLFNLKDVLVRFSVARERVLTMGTRVDVRLKNLTGDHYLELMDGPGPPTRLPPGGRIPISQTAGALDINVLLAGFRPLFTALNPDQVNQLSSELIAVLQGQSGTVQDLIGQVGSLTGTLADRDLLIGSVITNLNGVLGTVDGRDQQLADLVNQLQSLVFGLAKDRDEIGDSLEGINQLANSTADLLDHAGPPLTADIGHLGKLAGLLNHNSDTLDTVLNGLPDTYRKLTHIGSYGSFFNFYLCGVQVAVTGPNGQPTTSPSFTSPAERCKPK